MRRGRHGRVHHRRFFLIATRQAINELGGGLAAALLGGGSDDLFYAEGPAHRPAGAATCSSPSQGLKLHGIPSRWGSCDCVTLTGGRHLHPRDGYGDGRKKVMRARTHKIKHAAEKSMGETGPARRHQRPSAQHGFSASVYTSGMAPSFAEEEVSLPLASLVGASMVLHRFCSRGAGDAGCSQPLRSTHGMPASASAWCFRSRRQRHVLTARKGIGAPEAGRRRPIRAAAATYPSLRRGGARLTGRKATLAWSRRAFGSRPLQSIFKNAGKC